MFLSKDSLANFEGPSACAGGSIGLEVPNGSDSKRGDDPQLLPCVQFRTFSTQLAVERETLHYLRTVDPRFDFPTPCCQNLRLQFIFRVTCSAICRCLYCSMFP